MRNMRYTRGVVKKETSPEEYWASIEREIGEPIRAYVLARLPLVSESGRSGLMGSAPDWGLAFITDTTLYIDRSSTPNWFQRLVQRNQGPGDQEREVIAISAMSRVVVPRQKQGIARFLAGPEIQVDIHYRGGSTPLRILLDRRGPTDAGFIAKLEEIAARLDAP